MKVLLPKKEQEILDDNESDSLPADDVVALKKSDRERELELELAEKRGELKALKKSASPDGQMTTEQTKQLVYADTNNLSDEDFKKKYNGMSKHGAMMTVMDADNRQTKTEAKQLRAESEAVAELSATFGSDFYKYKSQILEMVEDLSEAARQDPERLKRWMKNQFVALSKDEVKPIKKASDDRRKVIQDFEKPAPIVPKDEEESSADDNIKDETPEGSDISNQKLANFMGIRSEKERKELASKDLIYVDMDLGAGIRFKDPKRGFEKVEKVA